MTSRSCTRKRDEQRCVGSLDEGVRETSGEMLRSRNSKVPDTRQFFPSLSSLSLPLPRHLFRSRPQHVYSHFSPPSLFGFLGYFSHSLCLFTNTRKLGRIHDIIAQSRDADERTTRRWKDDNWSPRSLGGSCLLLLLLPLADRSKSDPLLLSFSHVSRVFDSNRYHAS